MALTFNAIFAITFTTAYLLLSAESSFKFGNHYYRASNIPSTESFSDSGENPFQPRIAGGRNTKPGDVPYQIQIRYNNKYHCGAALVTTEHGNQVVITAGHCVTHYAPSTKLISTEHLSLVGGRVKIDGSHYYEQIRAVAKIHRHPDFRREYFLHYSDVAVLHLDKPFKLNNLIRTIALPWRVREKPDSDVVISGWGYTDPKEKQRAPILQVATIQAIRNIECDHAYENHITAKIKDINFCVGIPGRSKYGGACRDDDGSPAVVTYNNTMYLAGVFNWGLPNCGNRYRPSIYADLSYFIDWMNRVGKPGYSGDRAAFSSGGRRQWQGIFSSSANPFWRRGTQHNQKANRRQKHWRWH